MSERLRPQIDESRYWVGPDIATEQDIVIYSHELVPVTITPESVPPMLGKRPEALRSFRATARSRYAQLGLDPYEALTQQIAHAMLRNDAQDIFGNVTKSFTADVLIYNNGERPIHLMEGSRIFRLFNRWDRPIATGRDAVKLVESGAIELKGKPGKDWAYSYAANQIGNPDAILGVNVRIDDENRKWIPTDQNNTPIRIDENNANYRNEIDKLLVKVPSRLENTLWIGETAPEIVLHEGVDAIIDKAVLPDITGRIKWEKMGIQAESHFLQGGRTNWKVRVEVKSPTTKRQMPNAVTLYLAPRPELAIAA